MDKFWKSFKSGTDIRGVAVDGVEGEPLNLTDEVIQKMADGFVLWLSKKLGKSPDRLKISGDEGSFPEAVEGGIAEPIDYMKEYAAHLRDIICKGINSEHYDRPLKGLHIVVDAGNGAGGFYAYDVLEPLGADISGSVFLEPDGMFPHHIPNPEDKEAMKSICGAVLNSRHHCDGFHHIGGAENIHRRLTRRRALPLPQGLPQRDQPRGGTECAGNRLSACH